MLQYILNTTTIWLISLVVFDVFLRRESFHSYNRMYLVFTFLLGIFLPLYQWPGDAPVFHQARPLQQVLTAKESIVSGAAINSFSAKPVHYLEYVYLAGVLVSLLLLLLEIAHLARLYRTGLKARMGPCIVIETAKDHGPFSIFNYVFVRSRQDFSAEEWDALIAHEQLHGLLFHFADILLLQLARVAFWFHPLVYIYHRRLMMLHEYQADKVSGTQPQFYGRFLLAQAMLSKAPSISHSFNRSPIKNRIYMLTRKSTATAKIKMFVLLPLLCICAICCTRNSFAQKFEKNGNMVTYRGNKFEMSKVLIDTMVLIDPVTGKEMIKTRKRDAYPLKMNGKRIYTSDDIPLNSHGQPGSGTTLQPGISDNSLREYLLSNLRDEFKELESTQFRIDISNVVIDENGNVAYYENGGISIYAPEQIKVDGTKPYQLDEKTKKRILNRISELMENVPTHSPAYLVGDPVAYILSPTAFWNPFTIKGHVLTAE